MKTHAPLPLWLVLFALLTGSAQAAETNAPVRTYTNPILQKYLADPCVLLDGDTYYLTATGRAEDGRYLPLYRSQDLVHWEFVRGAVTNGSRTDWNFKHFWAPEIIKIGDTYHLYYTASPELSPENAGNRVGLAVAKNIEGPYENVGVVIPHAAIDGHPFLDRDGTLFLLYTIEHGNADGLKAGQIYIDRLVTPRQVAGHPVPLITEHPWQEGPWLEWRHGKYFLTYSCGNWKDATYHVRYALGDSPTGPFQEQTNRLLQTTEQVKGPGHHSLFVDRAGHDWIVYHGWDPAHTARYPRIDRIYYEGTQMRSDGPTSTPQNVDK